MKLYGVSKKNKIKSGGFQKLWEQKQRTNITIIVISNEFIQNIHLINIK